MKDIINPNIYLERLNAMHAWAVEELPVILFLTIGLLIGLRVVRYAVKRLTRTLLLIAEKKHKSDLLEAEKRINTLTSIIWGTVRIVMIGVYAMMVLQKMGVNIAPILASAGILGLAVGFGAQELVRDVISGFFILLENQVRAGDVAIINGTGGLVEKIELRTITLRDFEGVVHIFQNGKINSLSNRTKEWSAAVFDIGVAYKENVTQVMDVMKAVGDKLLEDEFFGPLMLEPMEIMGLDLFGDSAIVIKARIKTLPSKQWEIKREYNNRLKVKFDELNIEIPFPHTTVYWGEKIAPLQLNLKEKQSN